MYCHGFYAATTFKHRIAKMIHNQPEGMLGIRTGDSLGVLDFEGTNDGQLTYDNFEAYTGVELPRESLAQRTGGGGIHVILNTTSHLIKSRNRVLPDMDVKASGGYIAVGPSADGRGWIDDGVRSGWDSDVAVASQELLTWLTVTKGNFGGQGGAGGGSAIAGGDWYRDAKKNGCPGGLRDEFFNRLCFEYRKSGMEYDEARRMIMNHYRNAQQPPFTEWHMPWEHVQYKLDRTWATVEPDEVPEWQRHVLEQMKLRSEALREGQIVKSGRIAMVSRNWQSQQQPKKYGEQE
jgi:hypothetical protein